MQRHAPFLNLFRLIFPPLVSLNAFIDLIFLERHTQKEKKRQSQSYLASCDLAITSRPLPSSLIVTTAVSFIFTWPRMILSASLLPISWVISLLSGLAPNLGSYPLSASHVLMSSDTSSVMRLSFRRSCSSRRRMSTMSRRASRERRLNTMNSS